MKEKIITFVFVMLLASFSVATFLLPDRAYSEMENRYLSERPKLSLDTLRSGEFMEQFETYVADQIVGKDALVCLKTDVEQLLNRQGSGGVYFGRNGRYVKDYAPDEEQYNTNLGFLREFAERNKESHRIAMLLAPNVQSVYDDVLPGDIVMGDAAADMKTAKEQLTDLIFIDPTDTLRQHSEEELYFKTDHHWTMRGAYYAYQAMSDQLDYAGNAMDAYSIQVRSRSFYGTLYSKAPLTWAKKDAFEVFYNVLGKYRITYEDGTYHNSLFVESNLYGKDKYTYFLGGNHAFLTIQSNAETGKNALVLKDSYSHALLPFLADEYDKIDVVDLRYYRESVQELVQEGQYDDILFIYNLDFLTTDENFIWLN